MDDHRTALVREHGRDPITYSTLQQGLRYFDTSYGFIAYRRIGATDITLGPPVCADRDRMDILQRFLAYSPRPIVNYVHADIIEALQDSKLHCAGMGADRYVDLDAFLAQPSKEVRGACRKADTAGMDLEPVDFSTLPPETRDRLDSITCSFLTNARYTAEMSFLNRPMSFSHDGLRRGLLVTKNDREHQGVFGYAVLNPYFDSERVTGYMLDILRFEPTRLWGVWYSVVWRIAAILAAEGKSLSLGFSPLYGVRKAPVRSSRWLDMQIGWMVRYLSSSQYVRRLAEMKSAIPGRDEPRYFASYSTSAFTAFTTLLRACDVRPRTLCTPDLLRSIRTGLVPRRAVQAQR